jgi:ribosomal protein S18 acetylase RimI-like enzyme
LFLKGIMALEVKLRKGTSSDQARIKALYKTVAGVENGIARQVKEITDDYITGWIDRSIQRGWWVVAEDAHGNILGSIHAYRPEIEIFHHVLSELTIAVDPRVQGQGVGRQLFCFFQESLKKSSSEIKRVELFVRENNHRAKVFYESLGFKVEGRFEKRIKNLNGSFEADIPMAWTL